MKLNHKIGVQRRHERIRRKVEGTSERPRLAVFRSHEHIYVQIIDDLSQRTLVSSSTVDKELREALTSTSTKEAAAAVGRSVAERAQQAGITRVVFDRGGNLYHGRVQALAEAAREAGLEF